MADKNGIFEKVDPGTRVYRSRFNRSFRKLIDCHMGRLYPILTDMVLPGDIIKLGLRWNIKSNPSITPFFTPVKGSVFYFFVPLRQIFGTAFGDKSDTFIEDILTGGKDGDNSDLIPYLTYQTACFDASPDGNHTNIGSDHPSGDNPLVKLPSFSYLVSLSNCFGYPTNHFSTTATVHGHGLHPYPPTVTYHRAYWHIVSNYFIDEDTQPTFMDYHFIGNQKYINDSLDVDPLWSKNDPWSESPLSHPYFPFATLWSRDYFMSALKDFLKGTPPALGAGSLTIPAGSFDVGLGYNIDVSGTSDFNTNGSFPKQLLVNKTSGSQYNAFVDGLMDDDTSNSAINSPTNWAVKSPLLDTDIPISYSFGVDEMRLAFATQRILERANRCGSRYTEYLLSTFNTAPADGTLQRPYYLGGIRFRIVTPEVLQTSESGDTPQGNRSGAGFSVGRQGLHSFHAKEHGVIMALLNLEPEASFCDGMPRQARYNSRFSFFNPSMQNLSEQVVESGEIYAPPFGAPTGYQPSSGFGYQGLWNELRTKTDEISGYFRYSELSYWHMALRYTSPPALNASFKTIATYFSDIMRPFAVQNMPPFLCDFYHEAQWIRPMVKFPVPGLIDHN